MHELAITEEIVRIVTDKVRDLAASRATSVELLVGTLSGIVPESVSFYFEHLSKGTPCEGARLEFTRVKALARCRQCEAKFGPTQFDWTCPACGHNGADLLAGRELALATIEMEQP